MKCMLSAKDFGLSFKVSRVVRFQFEASFKLNFALVQFGPYGDTLRYRNLRSRIFGSNGTNVSELLYAFLLFTSGFFFFSAIQARQG